MSDERLRKLEREYATGDESVARALLRERDRVPRCTGAKHVGPWKEVCRLPPPDPGPLPGWFEGPFEWAGPTTHEVCEHCGAERPYVKIVVAGPGDRFDPPKMHRFTL